MTSLLLAILPVIVTTAQSLTIDWIAWDTVITASPSSSQLTITETQHIKITSGTVHSGERDYTDAVTIQSVYVTLNSQQSQALSQGSAAGQYQVLNTNGETVLTYHLPTPANAGDSFVVQINYVAKEATSGIIDWFVVPESHSVQVDSSKTTIDFPNENSPDISQVQILHGNGNVSKSGNSIIVTSQGAIPANQSFEIKIPYPLQADSVPTIVSTNPGNNANCMPNTVFALLGGLKSSGDKTNDMNTLIKLRDQINVQDVACNGMSIKSIGNHAIGPYTLGKGIYQVHVVTDGYFVSKLTVLSGTCPQDGSDVLGLFFMQPGQASTGADALIDSSGCRMIIIPSQADKPWTVEITLLQ